MSSRAALSLFAATLTAVSTFAVAQTSPSDEATPAPVAATWTSNEGTNAQTHARNCSVFPLRTGLYPFFYLEPDATLMSIEGLKALAMDLRLQVDANPSLDGGVLEPSPKVIASLIAQIRANGQTLQVSRSVITIQGLETVTEDIPLQGAVAQFDKCKAWLGG